MAKKIQPRQFRVRREIFSSGDFTMLQLIGTRLYNEFRPIDKKISFTISGNSHIGNRLEVEMMENTQLLKFIKRLAVKYRSDLKPYFSNRKK